MNKSFIIYFLVILAFLYSCNKNSEIIESTIDYSYFPFDTGKWIDYNITEIIIDADVDTYDTINYQLKEVFKSYMTDNEGSNSIVIERYTRSTDNDSWEIKDIWYATLYTNSAHRVEENIRYIKLIFPVEVNKSWNGNSYNIESYIHSDYYYSAIDEPYSLNTFDFDSVLTITQNEFESLIDKIYTSEKYAKNIGLVEKINIDVYSKITDGTVDIMDRITLGNIYIQEIINYGEN